LDFLAKKSGGEAGQHTLLAINHGFLGLKTEMLNRFTRLGQPDSPCRGYQPAIFWLNPQPSPRQLLSKHL
jgi:hypothetical protein